MAETPSKSSGLFGWYFGSNLLIRILTGLVLGAIVGVILGLNPGTKVTTNFIFFANFFGALFIRLLKMIVVPVILFSLITGAASITPSQLGRTGGKTLLYYIVTSIISVSIGLIVALVFRPGEGLNMVGAEGAPEKAASMPALTDVLLNIVPTNPVESLAKGDVLPIIFFALVVGIGLSYLRDSKNETLAKQAHALYDVIAAAAEVIYKVVGGIMQYAPIGVFALIAVVFAQQGPKVVGPLLYVTLAVYVGLILHLCIGYGGLMTLFGLNFVTFIKGAWEAMITAFVTRSSSGTLPVTLRVTEENLGVSRKISSFILPIGATVNMDGTSIYIAICAMFIGFAVGHPLSGDQMLMLMITATLAAIGTAGVPGAGAIMLIMALETVGLKVEAGSAVAATYALVLGIDALLDMGRTAMNVTGDMAGVTIVAKTEEGMLDESKWKK
ncbi:MAG: dicarboxylate/amino acid:cation symporter [Methylobacteriaceae bacterium]|jgi:Na+/H+-dicarboxylate symporter|nr:dicarboxylate/amino acid:cation symporter [Methylobacteriaceae bacterium]